eukprot:4941521-Pyramimonas_sp.AAC.1
MMRSAWPCVCREARVRALGCVGVVSRLGQWACLPLSKCVGVKPGVGHFHCSKRPPPVVAR